MKIKAPVLPLLLGVILGIIALTMPWLVARRYQEALGQTVTVERYMYYLWGQSYTVYGKEGMQQTFYTNYFQTIFEGIDFPAISMALVLISIILGIVSILGGRGTIINLRSKQIKIQPFKNPVVPLSVSAILTLMAWYYLRLGAPVIWNIHSNLEVMYGPANEFMLGSFFAFTLTAIITYKRIRDERLRNKDA